MEADARNPAQPLPMVSWDMLEISLAHPNALIREKAIETASRLADAKTISALQRAARDEDARVRAAAMQALNTLAAKRNPETDAALAGLISSGENHELRVSLIPVAASSGCEALLQAVIRCLVDESQAIRSAANSALQTHAPSWMLSALAAQVAPIIEAARTSPSVEAREAAGTLSDALRRAQVRRAMLESGVASILTLTTALRADSAIMREAAAWMLQQTGDARAVPGLVDTLRDPVESVRRTAAAGLATFSWRAATESEHAAQIVALGRWQAAAELGSSAVDALILAARSSRPATQERAIQCLAETRSVRALQPLQELLQAPDRSVRQAAARALKSLEWVPTDQALAVAQAIELENWPAAAALGPASVAPLMAALKGALSEPTRRAIIVAALGSIRDGASARALAAFCRDGEVASAAVQALSNLLEHQAAHIATDALTEIASLQNVVQFQFTLDPQYQKPVRSGMEFVNTDSLRAGAAVELARRSTAPAPAGEARP